MTRQIQDLRWTGLGWANFWFAFCKRSNPVRVGSNIHLRKSGAGRNRVTDRKSGWSRVAHFPTDADIQASYEISVTLVSCWTLLLQVQLPENTIRVLCQLSRSIFLEQSMLVELASPVVIAGDIHGLCILERGTLIKFRGDTARS